MYTGSDDFTPIDKNTYQYFERRKGAMKNELQSFIPHYQELSQFISPRRGRFLVTDVNKGDRRYNSIINSKATRALRIATSGLLAGVMSPARPWFVLKTPYADLNDLQSVKEWCYLAAQLLRDIFNGGNLYAMAPTLLKELIQFGTGAMSQVEDFHDVARFYTHTAGSYAIAQNHRFEVDTLMREFQMTVEQLVGEFGYKNCSYNVQTAYDRSNYAAWYPVTQIVEPNPDHKPGNAFAKAFRSVKYEPGCTGADQGKFLSRKGYEEFPAYCPRWETTGEDIYGTDCPAMTALGDIKGLQIEERRKAQAIDKMVNPPLTGPATLRNVPIANLPGGLTAYDGDQSANGGLRSIYTVQPRVGELMADIQAVEGRIDDAFYVDLFKPISNMAGIQPKNQFELSERVQESMLLIGPVLEHLHGELLSKMIDRTFSQCVRNDLLPPAPPELQGKPLKVEYISPLAMAQRAVATGGIDRMSAFIGTLVGFGVTSAMDKYDVDEAIDAYADAIGTPPNIIVSTDKAMAGRAAKAEQHAKQEQMAMTAQAASAAKDGTAAMSNMSTAAANAPQGAGMDNTALLKNVRGATQPLPFPGK